MLIVKKIFRKIAGQAVKTAANPLNAITSLSRFSAGQGRDKPGQAGTKLKGSNERQVVC